MSSLQAISVSAILLGVLLIYPISAWNAHGVLQSFTSVWEDVVTSAAKETLNSIEKRAGQAGRYLEAVPLDTLKVFVGRQHHLAVELDGQSYEVTLGLEADEATEHLRLPSAVPAQGTDLVPNSWWNQREHSLALPEVTLTGPLELVLSEPQPVSVFLPNSADVGMVRRVQLAAGASAKVSHMKSISLRHPVDLPRLPGQYLAEVFAQSMTGQPEQGYHFAPGLLFMSKQLREAAINATEKGMPLLSFEVEPAAYGALSIEAAGQHVSDVAPRLRVKRGKSASTIELSQRPGQVAEPHFRMHSLTHVWAWPLPHLDMSSWLPYEAMLRSMLASHPFNMEQVVKHGIPLKLTKSSIKGVSMMSFDMHVRSQKAIEGLADDYPFAKVETPLEIWEVVVQIQESMDGKAQGSRFNYIPVTVRLKQTFGNTMTFSEDGIGALFLGNRSVPLGFESEDYGVARYAP